jgi:hypothetical protein
MKKQPRKIRVSWSEPEWIFGAMGKKSPPKNPDPNTTWKKKNADSGAIGVSITGIKPPVPIDAEKIIAQEKRGRYSGREKERLLLDFAAGQIGSGKDSRIQIGKVTFYLYYDKPVWECRVKISHRHWKTTKGFSARDAVENAVKSRWMYYSGQWWSLRDLVRVTILLPGDSEGRKAAIRGQEFPPSIRAGVNGTWAWYYRPEPENRLEEKQEREKLLFPPGKTTKAHYSKLTELTTIERPEREGEGSVVPTFAPGEEPVWEGEFTPAKSWREMQIEVSNKLLSLERDLSDFKPLPVPEFAPSYERPPMMKTIIKPQKPSPEAYRLLVSGEVVLKPEQENLSRGNFTSAEKIPTISKAERMGIRPFGKD